MSHPVAKMGTMTNQLSLITSHRSGRLDQQTRRRGLDGVTAARAVLQQSRVRAREAMLAGESLGLRAAAAA